MEQLILPSVVSLVNLTNIINNILIGHTFNAVTLVYEHNTSDIAMSILVEHSNSLNCGNNKWLTLNVDVDDIEFNVTVYRLLFMQSNTFIIYLFDGDVFAKINKAQNFYNFQTSYKRLIIFYGQFLPSENEIFTFATTNFLQFVVQIGLISFQSNNVELKKIVVYDIKNISLIHIDPDSENLYKKMYYAFHLNMIGLDIYVYSVSDPPSTINTTDSSNSALYLTGRNIFLSTVFDSYLHTKSVHFQIKNSLFQTARGFEYVYVGQVMEKCYQQDKYVPNNINYTLVDWANKSK